MVERLAAGASRVECDSELLLHARLADEVVESPRPQRAVELLLVRGERGRKELRLAHAALRRASRTRSWGSSSGSVFASADSASELE